MQDEGWFINKKILVGLLVVSLILVALLKAQKVHSENNEEKQEIAEEQEQPDIQWQPVTTQSVSSIEANRSITRESIERVRSFLARHNSPLAPYTEEILKSKYWSTIIAITKAEQSFSKNPKCWNGTSYQVSNNLYGMMKSGGERAGIRCFASILEGFQYMDGYFERLTTRKYDPRTTIESLRGYYCASACTNWEPAVLQVKKELENL